MTADTQAGFIVAWVSAAAAALNKRAGEPMDGERPFLVRGRVPASGLRALRRLRALWRLRARWLLRAIWRRRDGHSVQESPGTAGRSRADVILARLGRRMVLSCLIAGGIVAWCAVTGGWLTSVPVSGALVVLLASGWSRRGSSGYALEEVVRLQRLLDSRAEQVAALSHELRTPLSLMKGASDLLLEGTPGSLTPTQEKFLRVIEQQCGQVIGLCETLLLQAKIEAGLFRPRPERVDLCALVRDAVSAMRVVCLEREQRISLDTPQVMRRMRVDPLLIGQALSNLLSNASRYTSMGGRIEVRVAAIDTGVAVYVSDDGAGMTREERSRLFTKFATGRPLSDGTGLGLAITKAIIDLHGGHIMVDPTSPRGTTFVFVLPTGES